MSESFQPAGFRPTAGPYAGQRSRLALTALAAAAALAVAAAALAQAPAPGEAYLDAPVAVAQVGQVDPSTRIATLTAVEGNLSFAPAGSDQWAATGLNRPVTTGDRLWMDAGGRAELHAGTVAMRMGGATAASVLNLDDNTTQVKLTQGTLQLRVRALPQDQTIEVDTPNLAFVPREPGDYRIDVAPDGSTTSVTMRHGSAVVYGDSRSIELQRGDRMRFAGTDLADAGGGAVPDDGFDRWTAARDAREDASPSARYLPREMPGYAALDDYGDWQEEPSYGAVWFPRTVSAGWAPYSAGHWAWIAPWGWTWIDDAPWGFAPSHYGRWAYVGTRWGWVPGPRVRPCYAPAVVAFVGGSGPGWNSVRVGSGPGVAWYPLGPRDAYRPVYRASPSYVARINRVTVNNIVVGDRGRHGHYVNRNVPGAITGMPARNFVEGRPVRGMHRPEWRNLPTGEARGGPPVAPVKGSLVGAAPVRPLPPQARHGFERQAIAAHPPGRPASDDLARRFAREGGVVPGAWTAWRGGAEQRGEGPRRPGRPAQEAQRMPDVRMSQAALAAREQQPRAGRGDPGADGWRGNGRSQSTRPDDGRGFAGQPDAQRQAQSMQREQQQALQRQQMDQQRALREQQRQGQEPQQQARELQRQQQEAMERGQQDQSRQWQGQQGREQQQAREQQRQQQEAMERRQQDQSRQWQGQQGREQQQAREQQRQQQEATERRQQEQQRAQQRQWADGQDRPDPARQSQEMQRQRFEQQRQMQEAQQRQAQEAQQRQMQEGRQRQAQDAQQRQMQEAQQRQMQEGRQRQAQDAQQRQMQEAQRQQMDQQRQAAEQQRQQVERQRQVAEQQRQGQEMQRQHMEQQRQAQEAQQRQAQEAQQRQAQAAQRQQMDQQRQMQEQHRQMQEQQRQQATQRQQVEQQQRAAQEQQRAMQEQQRGMQEQQRHQQEQQRQMQERQRQQIEQQRQQQQRAQHDRGQIEARNGRDGDRRQ